LFKKLTKMKKQIIGIFIIVYLSVLLVSATIQCTPSSITTSYNEGDSKQVSTQCTNNGNATTIFITGETGIISTTETNFNAGTKTINVDLSSNANSGLYLGSLSFGTGYSVPIAFNVIKTNIAPTSLISFPTSKRITVPQGEEYNRKVTMIMPSNYPNPINIQSIEFSEENNIISFGDVETGILNPGEVKDIPIKINAKEAQVGEYPTISVQIRLDDNGEVVTLSSALHITVTANLNPSTNVTFSSKPSCSISASTMNINMSYSFTCSNVQKNLEVSPVFNEYFEGQNVQLNGDIYIYEFTPIKYGNTQFISTFTYLGAPLFSPFKQDIKIASSGSTIPGTELEIKFTPTKEKILSNEEVILQLIDNKSGNLVNSPSIYINAIKLESLNNSEKSFPYKFDLGTNYEIRGEAEGYDNLIKVINITSKTLEFTITPNKEFYVTGDLVNISSNVNETSFLINNEVIENPESYIFSDVGNFTIKSINEDYISSEKNITVESAVFFDDCNYDYDKWKKGKKINCDLSENSTWSVFIGGELIESGDGDKIDFKISDYGYLEIRSGSYVIYGATIEKSSSWYNPFSWDFWGKIKWYWWIVGVLAIGGVWYYLDKKSDGDGTSFVMEG